MLDGKRIRSLDCLQGKATPHDAGPIARKPVNLTAADPWWKSRLIDLHDDTATHPIPEKP
jgi:hypothetical protein